MYQRVIPRDLFNEAKLLKCLGQVALLIHDGPIIGARVEYEDDGFLIDRDDSSGDLFCSNFSIFVGDTPVWCGTQYNSKDPYPLMFRSEDGDGYVLDDSGQFSKEFLSYVASKVIKV